MFVFIYIRYERRDLWLRALSWSMVAVALVILGMDIGLFVYCNNNNCGCVTLRCVVCVVVVVVVVCGVCVCYVLCYLCRCMCLKHFTETCCGHHPLWRTPSTCKQR